MREKSPPKEVTELLRKIEDKFSEIISYAQDFREKERYLRSRYELGELFLLGAEKGIDLESKRIYTQLIPKDSGFFSHNPNKAEVQRFNNHDKKFLKIKLTKLMKVANRIDQRFKVRNHRLRVVELEKTVNLLALRLDLSENGEKISQYIPYAIGDVYKIARELNIEIEEKYISLVPKGKSSSYYKNLRPVRRLKKVRELLEINKINAK